MGSRAALLGIALSALGACYLVSDPDGLEKEGMRPMCGEARCGAGELCVAARCVPKPDAADVDARPPARPDAGVPACECGPPSYGAWSACAFTSECAESGTQTREVRTPTCVGGVCEDRVSSETGACTRATTGAACGAGRTVGEFGACVYADECAVSGARSRSVRTFACSAGVCIPTDSSESEGCSRSDRTHLQCGPSVWDRCCGTSCRSLTTNSDCGVCGLACPGTMSCLDTGTGGYACGQCSGSSLYCQEFMGPAATCWAPASSGYPTGLCNCQCPTGAVCVDGGCGPTGYCHPIPGAAGGINWCAPFP